MFEGLQHRFAEHEKTLATMARTPQQLSGRPVRQQVAAPEIPATTETAVSAEGSAPEGSEVVIEVSGTFCVHVNRGKDHSF